MSTEKEHGSVQVPLVILESSRGRLPRYQTPDSSGLDLFAAVDAEVTIQPGARAMIPAGVKVAIPVGYEGQIRPRSGLAWRFGVTVLNGPGTIDADYRGEIKVVLINHGEEAFVVSPGDRIAQLVVAPVAKVELLVTTSLPDTQRGEGGYGSTGRR